MEAILIAKLFKVLVFYVSDIFDVFKGKVQCDSNNIVSYFLGSLSVKVAYKWLVEHIKNVSSTFRVCVIRKVEMEQVSEADFRAKQAYVFGFSSESL